MAQKTLCLEGIKYLRTDCSQKLDTFLLQSTRASSFCLCCSQALLERYSDLHVTCPYRNFMRFCVVDQGSAEYSKAVLRVPARKNM